MLSAHFDYISGRATLKRLAVTRFVACHFVNGVVDRIEVQLLKKPCGIRLLGIIGFHFAFHWGILLKASKHKLSQFFHSIIFDSSILFVMLSQIASYFFYNYGSSCTYPYPPQVLKSLIRILFSALKILYFFSTAMEYSEHDGIHTHFLRVSSLA